MAITFKSTACDYGCNIVKNSSSGLSEFWRSTRRILGTIVRSRHWTVCGEAEDGGSGVKKFHELKPDLVLLDLAMPDMDGIEAARLMSRSDPTVPIILFTVLDLEGLETRARKAGICAVVSKAQGWNLLRASRLRSHNLTGQFSEIQLKADAVKSTLAKNTRWITDCNRSSASTEQSHLQRRVASWLRRSLK
jgi:CheY-like chemotaxis protein